MKKYFFASVLCALISSIGLALPPIPPIRNVRPLLTEEPSLPSPCLTTSCKGRLVLTSAQKVVYYRTHSLNAANASITRAIVVVHGTSRTADSYFRYLVSTTKTAGKLDSTIIIAPHFIIKADPHGSNDIYWSGDGWKQGDAALNHGPSSFEVMDRIMEALGRQDIFPNLQEITVTGFSAGGQFTQRFMSASVTEPKLTGLQVQYLVGAPSTFMYLNQYRPVKGSTTKFTVPTSCSGYNDYKYGLLHRNNYMSAVTSAQIIGQHTNRRVTIIVGDQDTGNEDLDRTCEANWQGLNRYKRSVTFKNFLDKYFVTYPLQHTELVVVPGVAHSANQIYNSEQARSILF